MSSHAHKNSPFLSVLLVLLLFFFYFNVSFRWAESVNPFACDTANKVTKSLTFCNASLPIPDRVKDLIGRLTLKEKISLLVDKAAPVQRLTVNGYKWWSEALHGVSDWGRGTEFGGAFPGATSFPQVITTAAAFNSCLWEDIGRVVSDEARAMHNAGKAGLTFWSPNVNIFRDPRWGRGQETPGEDPFVVSEFGISYVRGLQGYTEGSGPLKVAACCKHYTAYDLDKWNGVDRFHFNAQVSQQDLEETYNAPFEQCVKEGNVACVMCSYNQVNDKPTCADPDLLRGTIRGQWNLNGYIVSDCDSIAVLYNQQHYAKTREDAVAMTIKAGLDLDCGEFLGRYTENAIRQRKLSEMDVNGALTNTFTVQMRLGMFNGDPSKQQYGHLGPKDVCTQDHHLLALDAARQGIVLLKNLNQSLPLSTTKYRSIAVIGPNDNITVTMIGNYFGDPCNFTTALQGIGSYAKTNYEQGCAGVQCKDNRQFRVAEALARGADATVLVMGLDQAFEREGFDRTNLFLPGRQQELVLRVAKASRGPTILVLMSGGPIDVSFAKDDPLIVAILWVGYPGQAGGAAIADILFGKTIPGAQAPMTDMNMRPNETTGYPGRTYRFYNGTVLYAFGDGLSYTTFTYSLVHAPTSLAVPLFCTTLDDSENSQASRSSHVRVSHANCAGLSLSLHLDLKNTGTFDGLHTVLAFATPPALAGKQGPMKQLVAFEKVHVVAASQRRVQMNVDVCKHLSIVDELGVRRIPMGEHTLHIGDLKHSVSLQTTLNQIKT